MTYHIYKANQRVSVGRAAQQQRLNTIITIAKGILLVVVGTFSLIATVLWLGWETPLVSPVSTQSRFSFLPYEPVLGSQTADKIVYGFVPYWNVNTATVHPHLTHIGYFALTIGPDGSLLTSGDSESEIGYQRLQSDGFAALTDQALSQNTAVELVVKQFVPDQTTAFLQSETAWENFFSQIDSVLLAYPFSGVNADIELASNAQSLQADLTQFMAAFRAHLKQRHPETTLSIDVYPSAALGQNIWNVGDLSPHVDYFVVMAYDFHRRQSPQAGPVSPLLGGEVYQNINQHLKEMLELVPPSQLLLGIPFYGYEWQTTSRAEQALTYPDTGRTASYQRVLSILDQKNQLQVQEHWNERALSPYLSYQENNETFVVYYENPRSLSYKLDYVNQLNLAGIAIWALGYEGDATDLWDTIQSKLQLPSEQ
jgi:spore germination protein YaaH